MTDSKLGILAEIVEKLDAICARVGGKKRTFVAHWVDIPVSKEDVAELFHDSGLLVKDGNPVFVYIRDHSYIYKKGITSLDEHNRIHFWVCEKLEEMRGEGRIKRYHATDRDDNLYPVDYDSKKTGIVRLQPCQVCLRESKYHGYPEHAQDIISNFDAKEALAFMADKLLLYWLAQSEELSDEYTSTGYASNHASISLKFRNSRNFICDKCGVELSHQWWLTDTHHINGVKNDNRTRNLKCLCKLCHQALHPHYRLKSLDAAKITEARREQGIRPPPKAR